MVVLKSSSTSSILMVETSNALSRCFTRAARQESRRELFTRMRLFLCMRSGQPQHATPWTKPPSGLTLRQCFMRWTRSPSLPYRSSVASRCAYTALLQELASSRHFTTLPSRKLHSARPCLAWHAQPWEMMEIAPSCSKVFAA